MNHGSGDISATIASQLSQSSSFSTALRNASTLDFGSTFSASFSN
jgi:hypothetical protein